jgi:hypothetical protein
MSAFKLSKQNACWLNEEKVTWQSVLSPVLEENTLRQSGGVENKRLMPWLRLSYYKSTWIIKRA